MNGKKFVKAKIMMKKNMIRFLNDLIIPMDGFADSIPS